ncbi:reverse transcriptase domain-containing protein [Tanacetum coccineum]
MNIASTGSGQRLRVKLGSFLHTTIPKPLHRETKWPLGHLRLFATIENADCPSQKAWMNFMIVRPPSSYNGIIRRPRIREIQAVPSTAHGMLSSKEWWKTNALMARFLKRNLDIFASRPSDMAGVPTQDSRTQTISGGRIILRSKKKKGPGSRKRAKASKAEHNDSLENVHRNHESIQVLPTRFVTHISGRLIGRSNPSAVILSSASLTHTSHTEAKLLRYIEETFCTLRKINMKLNPKKCTFGAVEGMFLGYMIGPEGIKPCPEKIEAVLQLPSPRTVKEVQSLNGKLAGLNRFLSKSAEKSLPLFKTLKKCVKKSDFRWTPEAEKAFEQLKQHISELPMLVAPRPKEELIMYLSASQGAVGAVLMTERDSIQTPVYFVSRALQGPELNYTPMEKLVLALVFAAKRLRRYFQAHPIAVITDQPIRQVMSRPEVAGRLQKWSIMLGEHNITYRPRTSVKGQILADFLVEKPEEGSTDMSEKETPQEPWTLFTDGSSCIDGSGAGLILTSPEGAEFTYALRFQFTASNNEAEYEALLAGLRIAAQMGVRNIRVSVDSKLVANQVLGTYIAKEENMIKYLEKVKSLVSSFASFSISQVPRSHNKKADALSKIASTSFAHLSKQVLVEVLQEKSIQEREVTAVVEKEGPSWITPITEYLKDGVLPDNKK